MIRRIWLWTLLAATLAGCANSHLHVSIDTYDEDARFTPPMSAEEALKLQVDIESLRQAAIDRTSQRKFLATASRNIFIDTWTKVDNADPALSAKVDMAYRAYLTGVDTAFDGVREVLENADNQVNEYLASYALAYADAAREFKECESYRVSGRFRQSGDQHPPKECHVSELTKKVDRLDEVWILRRLPVSLKTEEAKARTMVGAAASAYRSFANPTATVTTPIMRPASPGRTHPAAPMIAAPPVVGTDTFVVDWIDLRSRLNLLLESAQLEGARERYAKLTLAIQAFNAQMTSLAASMKLIPKEDAAARVAKGTTRSPKGLLESSVAIALELESLRTDLPDNASAQTALAGLARNSSEFVEVIDRLQDMGDPVWRIITDPANEAHWNKDSAGTDFYAEGKSSVVLVRNDPARFDVHDATNNPTALIKGQLEISRAVANAAISVASASIGMPAPPAAGGGAKSTDTSTTAAPSDAASAFASRKATADEAARLRDRQIRGLELELSSTLAAINAGPDPVPASQVARLDALLKAYKTMFDATATPSP